MKSKFYAVKNGRQCGLFNTWDECLAQVKGFKGAEYKSFATRQEALAYLQETDTEQSSISKWLEEGWLVAFCDGSFEENINRFSYGVVIVNKDESTTELSGCSDNEQYMAHRNISGEILGAVHSMKYALDNGYSKLVIFHDLQGLSKWADLEWKADSPITKKYADVVNNFYKLQIKIKFEKVTGHSNNKYNDMADRLAKNALHNKEMDDLSILERPSLFSF
jgi:ribonuclease HI